MQYFKGSCQVSASFIHTVWRILDGKSGNFALGCSTLCKPAWHIKFYIIILCCWRTSVSNFKFPTIVCRLGAAHSKAKPYPLLAHKTSSSFIWLFLFKRMPCCLAMNVKWCKTGLEIIRRMWCELLDDHQIYVWLCLYKSTNKLKTTRKFSHFIEMSEWTDWGELECLLCLELEEHVSMETSDPPVGTAGQIKLVTHELRSCTCLYIFLTKTIELLEGPNGELRLNTKPRS